MSRFPKFLDCKKNVIFLTAKDKIRKHRGNMALERTPRTLYLMEKIIKDKPSPEQRFLILNKIVAQAGIELIALSELPAERDKRRERLKAELADAEVQLQLLMLDLGFDSEEILKLGLDHTFERFQEFEERGWSRK